MNTKLRAPLRHAVGAGAIGALLSLLPVSAWAQQVDVSNAWVPGTVPAQTATGAFMTLRAHEPAKLVGATSSAAAQVELHEMRMEDNVMRMREVKSIELPRMKDVELKRGGLHVMLSGLKNQLKPGDKVPLTLRIEQGGKVTEQVVTAEVRDMAGKPAQAQHDHKH